jgi:hypothetical protein
MEIAVLPGNWQILGQNSSAFYTVSIASVKTGKGWEFYTMENNTPRRRVHPEHNKKFDYGECTVNLKGALHS